MAATKQVNMTVYVVTAIPHNRDVLPWIVGVFSNYDTAEEAVDVEMTISKDILCDIHQTTINVMDAHKYELYVEIKEREQTNNA